MRLLGMIGGMSAESTMPYYRQINAHVAARLGGLHSAPLLLYSVDFAPIAQWQAHDRWDAAGAFLAGCGRALCGAGAQGLILCTNTMHKVAPAIEAAVDVPFLHIADVVAQAIRASGLREVGLLGTRFTMEQAFYRERLQQHGVAVRVPGEADRELVHRVIFEELCKGRIEASSRLAFREVIARLAEQGAEAVVLGCTEIGLLIGPEDSPLPLFDTTALHARAAAEFVLG